MNKLYKENSIKDIADAIREKNGEATTYRVSEMGDAVRAIKQDAAEQIEWHQCPELPRNYLANVTYDPSDYTVSYIAEYAPADRVRANYKPVGKTVAGKTYYNNEPNVAVEFSGEDAHGTIKPLDHLRYINTPIAENVRDLGGWDCDGGTVKYGLLFRGGEVNAKDRDVLVGELGVRHDLNLRGELEATWNSSPLGEDIYFTKAESYNWYTVVPNSIWKTNLRCIFNAVTRNEPVYFHCAAGADRTGTLACVLEGLLGVSQSDIDKDYELTTFYTGSKTEVARVRTLADWKGLISAINNYTGATFRDKCVDFVARMGFTADEINAYRKAMINGSPETIILNTKTFAITNNLVNVSSDNTDTSAKEYQSYESRIKVPNGYVIENVKVTMNGVDITSTVFDGTLTNRNRAVTVEASNCEVTARRAVIDGQDFVGSIKAFDGYALDDVTITMGGKDMAAYYADGKISIPNVTGDIVITATAVASAPGYTNQVAASIDTDGSIYNGKGYIENKRINSSGNVAELLSSGYDPIVTGFIPIKVGDVLCFKNAYILNRSSGELNTMSYDENFAKVADIGLTPYLFYSGEGSKRISVEFGETGTKYQGITKMTILSLGSTTKYMRFTLERASADLEAIITINEEINSGGGQ